MTLAVITRLEMQFRNYIYTELLSQRERKQQVSAAEANAIASGAGQVPVRAPLRAARASHASRRRSYFVEYTHSNMG